MTTPQPIWGPAQETAQLAQYADHRDAQPLPQSHPAMQMQQPEPPPLQVIPQPGDELDEWLGQYEVALAQARDAEKHAKSIDAKIKGELSRRAVLAGAQSVEVAGNSWRKSRTLNWVTKRKLNRKRFDKDYPGVYEQYLEYGDGYWSW